MKNIETCLWRQKGRWLVFTGLIPPESLSFMCTQKHLDAHTLPTNTLVAFWTFPSHFCRTGWFFLVIEALTNLSYNLPGIFFLSWPSIHSGQR